MAPLIILMYALFASSFTIAKHLLGQCNVMFLMGLRFFSSGIILLTYQYFASKDRIHIRKKKHFWLLAQITLFGIFFSYAFRFWGMKTLSSSKTALLFNSSPFFAALYAYIFFKEVMTKKQWLGLLIGFLGMIPILLSTTSTEQLQGELLFISWPEISIFVAVALQNYGWVAVRKLVRDKSYDPSLINGITMLGAGIMALIVSAITEDFKPIEDPINFFGWLAFLVVVSNVICHNIYGHLLKTYSTTFLSFSGFLVPIFAGLYGWAFLGETIGLNFYLSMIIVSFGLFLFYQDELLSKTSYYE